MRSVFSLKNISHEAGRPGSSVGNLVLTRWDMSSDPGNRDFSSLKNKK